MTVLNQGIISGQDFSSLSEGPLPPLSRITEGLITQLNTDFPDHQVRLVNVSTTTTLVQQSGRLPQWAVTVTVLYEVHDG